jgi:hypothetical protein
MSLIEPKDEPKKQADEGLNEQELKEVSGGKYSEFNPQPDPPGD